MSAESIKLLQLAFGPTFESNIRTSKLNRYQKNTLLNTIIPRIKAQLNQALEDYKKTGIDEEHVEMVDALSLILALNFGENNV